MKTLTYTAKCSRQTHHYLREFLDQQRQWRNAGLEARITAYKRDGVSVGKDDQFKELTELRQSDADFAQYLVSCQRSILTRLDKAFRSFFARVKRGEKPGCPRFKGRYRQIHSFEIPTPAINRVSRRHVLTIKGIGKFRSKGPMPDGVKQARIVVTPRRIKVS